MRAVVVYESLWGNTASVARAIAEGIGSDARAMTTDEATPAVVAEADLLVAGAPVLGFSLPTEKMRESVRTTTGDAPVSADLTHRSMRAWLASLRHGKGRAIAFETRLRGPIPGSATKTIMRELQDAGFASAGRSQPFYVAGKYGPLREGELERARLWGEDLARIAD